MPSRAPAAGWSSTRAWPAGRLGVPLIDPEACNGCAVCVTACVYGAIHVFDGRAALDGETCERCGLCVTRCRLDAIRWPAEPSPGLATMRRDLT